MTFSELRTYLLSKPATDEAFPFGVDTHVFKLRGKVFAILFEDKDEKRNIGPGINLKCHPDQSPGLRDLFEGITPGYHMNKKHWNTIKLNSDVPEGEITRLVDHSYELIFDSLTKKDQLFLK